ncbi:hypothetical protein N510_001189 [Firmicutes bacterium ASF500]|nr:hypothetical protein N510_001189 [Firmicutes bacterium ASF500]
MTNQKYEITDIAHPEYPFLHRIRALRDIGSEVKAGDLGGFVEHEGNLSYEDADSWIYNDAIAANGAFVYEGAALRDHAVACGEAKICKGAVLSDRARAEDHAHVAGGRMENYARLSGHGLVSAISPSKFPVLSGECTVYGIVAGNVLVTSQAVVLGDEKIAHDGLDQLVVTERGRSIQRSPNRDKLLPSAEYFGYEPPKRKPRRKQKEAER